MLARVWTARALQDARQEGPATLEKSTYPAEKAWQLRFCWSLVVQSVENPPAVRETQVWSLGWEDPLEKEMATHSSILAWRIPWTEEPGGGLQSTGSFLFKWASATLLRQMGGSTSPSPVPGGKGSSGSPWPQLSPPWVGRGGLPRYSLQSLRCHCGEGALSPLLDVEVPSLCQASSNTSPVRRQEQHHVWIQAQAPRGSPLKPQGSPRPPSGDRRLSSTLGLLSHLSGQQQGSGTAQGTLARPKSRLPLALLMESVSVVFDAIKWLVVKTLLSCDTSPLVVLCLERTGLLEGSFLCVHWHLGFQLLWHSVQHIWGEQKAQGANHSHSSGPQVPRQSAFCTPCFRLSLRFPYKKFIDFSCTEQEK